MRLYDFHESGNGYKVRLLLNQLGVPHERIELDILKGETRTPDFLAKNPNGRIPLLELDDGTRLAESNAILFYLARGTDYLPEERLDQARVLQWMFFEQYSHEPYIAVVRFWHFSGQAEAMAKEIPARMERGYQALGVMEQHLAEQDFFVGGRYSIADIALYAYTHVAEEGRFELARFPKVQAWLARVAAQSGHIPITKL
ncbi:MAG: glutathione S-transferase family protein [Kiloniellales bacterium]|nr:glutathione S-transferase family protein [Kiloniellales bacterium]